MLTGIKLEQPIQTNDPSRAEEALNARVQAQQVRVMLANARFMAAPPAKRRVIMQHVPVVVRRVVEAQTSLALDSKPDREALIRDLIEALC